MGREAKEEGGTGNLKIIFNKERKHCRTREPRLSCEPRRRVGLRTRRRKKINWLNSSDARLTCGRGGGGGE